MVFRKDKFHCEFDLDPEKVADSGLSYYSPRCPSGESCEVEFHVQDAHSD